MHPAEGFEIRRIAAGSSLEADARGREAEVRRPCDAKIAVHDHPGVAHLRDAPDRQGLVVVVVQNGHDHDYQNKTQDDQHADGGEQNLDAPGE